MSRFYTKITGKHRKHDNQYIKKQGNEWVVTQKGTGTVLSRHASRDKAEASFRAMEANKHA
jgi:hypothetical protein